MKHKSESGKTELPWSEAEIVRHYRTAKDPAEMIMILAELNGTTTHRICEVLTAAGVEPVPIKPTRRQTAHLKVVLVDQSGQYTFRDVARMHGLSSDALRHRVGNNKQLVLDGRAYQVKSYHRRG